MGMLRKKRKRRKTRRRARCLMRMVTWESSWSEFSREQAKDERFKAIEKSRDRETYFTDYVAELKKKEKDEKDEKRKAAKKGFKELLKETEGIDHHSHWSDFKKMISEDPRYVAVDKSNDREDWFLDYVQELKDEHRREKDKDRSRSHEKSKKKKKDKDRSRSRDRDVKKEKKKKKDKEQVPKQIEGQEEEEGQGQEQVQE